MKKILTAIMVCAVVISAVSAYSQQDEKQAYVKPELRGAITVTPAMLAPMRLTPGEYWFSAIVSDPRSGDFKGGYLTYKFSSDGKGLQVISAKNVLKIKAYNITATSLDTSSEEVFSPAYGRILRERIFGNESVLLNLSTPNSSIRIDKSAEYDWNNNIITIKYGNDPKAPVRQHAIEEDTTSVMSLIAFMLKCKWTDTSKIYRFHYFNIGQERYEDLYIKCSGKRKDNVIKYESVWHGFGEGGQWVFWVTLPKAGAANGMFQKYIADPKTSRYTTYKLTTKKEALKPVRPFID
jgi:hypothetical protein